MSTIFYTQDFMLYKIHAIFNTPWHQVSIKHFTNQILKVGELFETSTVIVYWLTYYILMVAGIKLVRRLIDPSFTIQAYSKTCWFLKCKMYSGFETQSKFLQSNSNKKVCYQTTQPNSLLAAQLHQSNWLVNSAKIKDFSVKVNLKFTLLV